MTTVTENPHTEREVDMASGWVALPIVLFVILGSIAAFICSLTLPSKQNIAHGGSPNWYLLALGILGFIIGVILTPGFFTLQPNEARVLLLFGKYKGTSRKSGFHWGNPFYSNFSTNTNPLRNAPAATTASLADTKHLVGVKPNRFRISLRVRNMNSERLKVNDKRGNPIEIAAVIVWRVRDTAQAMFDVDDYENYVRIQSESAIRHLASTYAYDQGEEHETTLLSGLDEVSENLRRELQARLNRAGVAVEEARLTHLAYAPEIAQVMLRRQQAEAVIAARQKIVHGAVSMVDMALRDLALKQVVTLDDERKAAMVSNLMVVLCGEGEVHPVINTGSLYT